MTRKLKRGVGSSSEYRHVRLPHYMLKSQAWRTMPALARALLIEVWARHNGVNNGEISFACSEAQELVPGCSKPTAARIFKILIERGFLAVVRESSFGRKRIARTWRLTALPVGDKPATKDFMRWRANATETREPKNFPSFTHETLSPTGETQDAKLTPTVSPTRLTEPIPPPHSLTHETLILYQDGTPIRPSWRPRGVTSRAANELGLRYGDVCAAVNEFRARHLALGDVSTDWDAVWLDELRSKALESESCKNLARLRRKIAHKPQR